MPDWAPRIPARSGGANPASPEFPMPTDDAPKLTAPVAVMPPVEPRRTHTAPSSLFSPPAPTDRSARPSLLRSARRMASPNMSDDSLAPGTPEMPWLNDWAPVPVRPEAPPRSTQTLPAWVAAPMVSKSAPKARSG